MRRLRGTRLPLEKAAIGGASVKVQSTKRTGCSNHPSWPVRNLDNSRSRTSNSSYSGSATENGDYSNRLTPRGVCDVDPVPGEKPRDSRAIVFAALRRT